VHPTALWTSPSKAMRFTGADKADWGILPTCVLPGPSTPKRLFDAARSGHIARTVMCSKGTQAGALEGKEEHPPPCPRARLALAQPGTNAHGPIRATKKSVRKVS
jgi:hypothetical protein